ncbi:hypothetical protein [Hymenobacter psychrotolerans]|nr:hypothetical protein [Hymenobacter psychrotolerans]
MLDQFAKDKAWASFLQQIEHGQAKDPLGQYVSKDTYLDFAGNGPRPSRPKYNAYSRQATVSDNGSIAFNYVTPCSVDGEPCTGGGGSVPPTFISTEGMAPYSGPDNPNGYIYDLKLVAGPSPQPSPTGYTLLNLDLNDQAGGASIHLTFTRNPSTVENGKEYYESKPFATGPVSDIKVMTGCCSAPYPGLNYYDIWWYPSTGTNWGYNFWETLDLNNGAWGSHIWSYQSKATGRSAIEIGILSGDNDRIQPPSGWQKRPTDLNQGAGGKFIYFCVKSR